MGLMMLPYGRLGMPGAAIRDQRLFGIRVLPQLLCRCPV